jgi:Putative Actinobacterial Holin-X, holin superfamily III
MLAPSGELLRAGVELKLNQIRHAARAYLRDRTHQATDTVTSYATAAALFAAAGMFLIGACFVGIMALFRWVEINYGMFWAFGAVGLLLLIIAAICAGIAMGKLKRPPRKFPSLASRLGAAIRANPIRPDQADPAQDLAASIPLASAAPTGREKLTRLAGDKNLQLVLMAGATLLGWAVVRRRRHGRHAAHRTEI